MMARAAAFYDALLAFVGNPQFPVVAATALLVAAGVLWGRNWYLERSNGHSGGVLVDAFTVIAPYLAGLAIIGLALFAAGGKPRPWYETAATLLAALALIRLVVLLLRVSLGKSRAIKTWELRATLIVWSLVAAETLGLLDPVVASLDSIGLSHGKTRITVWSVMKAIATVTVFVVASAWIARWIDRRVGNIKELAPSTRIGIGKFAYALLIAFGVLFGLQASGVALTTLTVFSGAIGLGLGFGLQAVAGNFVSGFVLLVDRSVKPGDVISFTGATGTSTTGFGWVEELRGRHVVIRDRDGVATLVPNQDVITKPLINWSYGHPRVRLRLPVRIAYHDDVELALSLLLKAAEHPRILRDPPAVSRLLEFADYGMEIELRFWIGDPAEGVNNVRSDVNRKIWALFREHGITIPPAQREIR
ncbi:MAG TPA: mechanosensitive ion channel domain-containing protein, partial [Steroidobacteraceae bacterium]|nr:mechanosensitive ion channel domain-containing protein [Steroidobacteraceae bacterium]